MFDSSIATDEINEPTSKKKKVDKLYESKPIHSSLEYSSIKAPPLVTYKSISSYCEKYRSEPSTSGVTDIKCISSPVILRTERGEPAENVLREENMPYSLFSVEELSLVKSLENWTNVKVSAVGQVSRDLVDHRLYLNSACESGQWRVTLNTSLLEQVPMLQQPLQIYGMLMIQDECPYIKVCFTRSLAWVNLPMFVDSYKLLQKHTGTIGCAKRVENYPKSKFNQEDDSDLNGPKRSGDLQMNDTLDNFIFDNIG